MVVAGGSLRFRHTACVCEPGDGIWGRVRHSETPCSPLSQPSCGPRHPCTPLSMHVPTEPLTAVSGLSDMGLLGSWPGPHGWVLRAGEEKRACRAAPPQQQGPHRPPPPSPSALSSISLLGKRGGSLLGRAEGQLEAAGQLPSQPQNEPLVLPIPQDWHADHPTPPPSPAQLHTIPRDPPAQPSPLAHSLAAGRVPM